MNHNYAVIIAGGSGERFWPLSTQARPKQFVSLFGGKPLLRHAVERLAGLIPPERILIVTSASLAGISAEVCDFLPRGNIIGEPCRRDTAAACALATGLVAARDEDGVLAILTADQLTGDDCAFRRILADSFTAAASGDSIVTIGVKPTYAATGFGYIEAGEHVDFGTETEFRKARRFVEKPDADTARKYLEIGNFCWNSGMFAWHVKTMSAAVRSLVPGLAPLLTLPAEASSPDDLAARLDVIYPSLEKISVDYAIMEHYGNIVTAGGSFGWDDVGSWTSIPGHFPSDSDGNVRIGETSLLDSHGNIVVNQGGGIVALAGCEDLIVVQTGNATLVCPKSKAQDIKRLVRQMGECGATKQYI